MTYYGDDGGYDKYGRPLRRPSPHQMRSDGYLDPGNFGGLHRSRSTGARPMPQINVYNKLYQENDNRSPSPLPYPQARQVPQYAPQYVPQYVPYPVVGSSRHASPRGSPSGRGRSRSRGLAEGIDGLLSAELADMAFEHRYGRSRSRGRSDAPAYDGLSSGLAGYQLAEQAKELRRLSQERQWKLEEEKIRNQIKLEQLTADAKRERDERDAEERKKRMEEDWERRIRLDREKKDAAERAAVEEYERKQREAKKKAEEAERAIKEKMEREAREKKQREKELYDEFKRKEKEEEDREKREWAEFERKRKEKEAKEKQKKADAEKEFQDEMRRRLKALGYTDQTIEIMVDEEKTKTFQKEVNARSRSHERRTTTTTQKTLISWDPPTRAPVYPKVHKDYIELKTLEYYQLPWHYDRDDPDFIIIQRDMDKRHTDVLFEHTARIRKGALLLEAPKKEKFAMYRKRSKSRHGHGHGAVIEKGVLRLG